MGRKRSHRAETRTKIVSARLTHDTYEIISEHAERLGLTRAGYVEHLIESRPLKITRGQADELSVPLINELKRIGNNLNQIAHARNAGADIDPTHFHTVLAEIIRVICRNQITRKHYEEAYTEVVGAERDDAAIDPAKRGMPPPVPLPPDGAGIAISEDVPAIPRYSPDAPRELPAPGYEPHWEPDLPMPTRYPPAEGIAPIPPHQPVKHRMERHQPTWSAAPRHLSSVSRHDSAPPSAWSKLLRRLHLRSS